jgi:hypothetical protein
MSHPALRMSRSSQSSDTHLNRYSDRWVMAKSETGSYWTDNSYFQPLPSRDTAKFEKYAVEQRTQDTRKVGGMTAVSGNSNSNRGPVRRNANPSRKNTKSLASSRTETRSLTKVMSKADGFV